MLRSLLTALTLGLLSFTSASVTPVDVTSAPVSAKAISTVKAGNALSFTEKKHAFDAHVQAVYDEVGLQHKGLSLDVFRKAYIGYQNFERQKLSAAKPILTIVDFTKNSRQKRLWVVDVASKKVLYNTLVAHGRNTGNLTADKFSNQPNSYMSSVGFYLTDATYYGKHGLSLRLSGMDKKYNSNAMARAIVVHGADYATEKFVKQYGRLGRSLGCPALPQEISKDIIQTIKNKTVLYVHGNEATYTSDYLDQTAAVEAFAAAELENLVRI